MMHEYGMGYGFLFQLLIFVAFFLVIWWLLKNNKSSLKEEPIEIIKRRLANGEITKTEFESLKKDLM